MTKQPYRPSKSLLPSMQMNELSGMGSEGGFDAQDQTREVRYGGFISLLLGLISWVSILAIGAIVVPMLGLLAGLVALRPVRRGMPNGIMPARIGICLCVGFGVCAYMVPFLKNRMLGNQAKAFALDYVDVVNAGYETLGIELMKEKRNRFSKELPLNEYYESSDTAQRALVNFGLNGANHMILGSGPDARWELDRPVHVFRKYGVDRAHLVFRDQDGKLLQFQMHYVIDQNDVGQWHIEHAMPHRERIVAESVL